MRSFNGAIITAGFFALVGLGALFVAGAGQTYDMGCLILGSEVNGNNSVEYLGIGNC